MADLPDWLLALLGQQGAPQGAPALAGNAPGGLLSGSMPPALGGLLTAPRPVPVEPGMDNAADPNTPIRVAARDMTQGRSVATGGTDIPSTPTSGTNVVGTPASGTTEASSPGFLSKAGQVLGSLYGQGGPGDSLIQLGAGIASPEGWAKGVAQASQNMGNNQLNQARLQAFKLQVAQQTDAQNKTRSWLLSQTNKDGTKALTPEAADAALAQNAAGNPAMINSYFKQYGEPDKYSPVQTPAGPVLVNKYDPTDIKPIGTGALPNVPLTDPAQRAKYGISPDDRAPYSLNTQTNKVEGVGGGGTKIYNVPEENYTVGLTKALTATHAGLAGGVEASQGRARDIAAMQGALARIEANGGTTGIGSEEKAKLQSALNTGWNTIGGSGQPFSVDDAQLLSKFNRQLAGGQAKDTAGARVTNFEMKNFLESNAGLALDPNANKRLLGIQSQIEERNINVGQAIRDMTAQALQDGRQVNAADVEKLIRGYDANHHITDPITGQDLTQNVKLGNLPTTEKGDTIAGVGSNKRLKFNPQTGAIE